MSKEKQIEEMACEKCLHYKACLVNSEYVPSPCRAYEDKTGYRKQSEGEWKFVNGDIGYDEYGCSVCGENVVFEFEEYKYKFCPHCGAKMKGGEEW
jgi:hypothetical protein